MTILSRAASVFLVCVAAAAPLCAADAPATADAAWQHLETLRQQLSADAPKGVNEVEFSLPTKRALAEAAGDFLGRFPDDPRHWDAALLALKTVEYPTAVSERRATFAGEERLLADIIAAPAAPATVKQNAERTVIFQHLDHLDLIDTPAEAVALEARLRDFIARHPDDPKAYALQVRRLDLLEKSDPAQAAALLDTLAVSPDVRVAEAAQGRQRQKALANAPLDWKFTAVDGTPVDLAHWRGRYVLVEFWASWCPDCLREMPAVYDAYHAYHDRGLEVIGVSLDNDHEALVRFLKKHAVPWPQAFDGQGWKTPYAVTYGVRGIPEMWLLDRDGKVIATGLHGSQLEARLSPLLPP